MKTILAAVSLAVIAIFVLGVGYTSRKSAERTKHQTNPSGVGTYPAVSPAISPGTSVDVPVITSPKEDETVKSPVTITGTVPPGWMFEGQFSVEIRNEKAETVGSGTARELHPGDWTIENPVAFTATVDFKSATGRGTIILLSDNPSGNPQLQKSYHQVQRF